jgi:DNA invertase Pin-like site-specific DNA recombinase
MSSIPLEQPSSVELEAVAAAAGDRVRAMAGPEPPDLDALQARMVAAATSALAAGRPIAAIAAAEQHGVKRAREEVGGELLRRVARAHKRKREADAEHQQAIRQAARIGLSHREIAQAAETTHGTIRAIVERGNTTQTSDPATQDPAGSNGSTG